MWQKIYTWWCEFIHQFIFTRKAHLADLEDLSAAYRKERELLIGERIKAVAERDHLVLALDDANAKLEKLQKVYEGSVATLSTVTAKLHAAQETATELKNENLQLREAPEVNREYLREVQKQLGKVYEEMEGYGYRNELAIPGSICVVCDQAVAHDGIADIRGRAVLDDQTTKAINEADTMYYKYQILINYLLRFGGLNQVVKNLIQNGAIQFVLAYRESTTTYECFFNVNAKSFEKDAVLTFSEETGTAVHMPGTVDPVEE